MNALTSPLLAHPHAVDASEVLDALDVDAARGLDDDEVARRLESHGPNKLVEASRRPAVLRLIDQFRDVLIMILLAAAVVSFVVSGELKTPVVVLVVVVLNAVIGFVQENRAEASLEALRSMVTTRCRVRRDGQVHSIAAEELVPGDIVLIEAGDRVPADGRIIVAVNTEIEEAALTGESQPSAKTSTAAPSDDVPLGDRTCMAYMNTTVTRGRAELVTTGTGMSTEIGRIAGLLSATETDKTPLQKQLEGLAHSLARLSGVIVVAVIAIGLVRGDSFSDLLNLAVALAVATIPEGLPAVTAVTLALGVARMAHQNAIVKRLASVETLGCTSVICSDKTGTLTLNEMTARVLDIGGVSRGVTGEGYDPSGELEGLDHADPSTRDALMAMALCSDAVVRADAGNWRLVGDPTEGALVTLAMKGGIDPTTARGAHPRLAEVPFESATKYMATMHSFTDASGRRTFRMFVKGAPDVVVSKCRSVVTNDGHVEHIETHLDSISGRNAGIAGQGMRVLALAQRDFDDDTQDAVAAGRLDPADIVSDLTLLALVGIVDPPRPEARLAIAEARDAGIAVKMITGDHAETARAIGGELGLSPDKVVAVTGSDLDRMTDEELNHRLDEISVFARVSPEHKIRLVTALQRQGRIVAMTGDGVNDAPALKKADIGVAMGITGTDVTKEAATMVLTDDNFATIVNAARQGRTIYDNVVKFVRFQLSTTLGFAVLFLVASVFDIANGKPFAAIAILWVNIIMDGPPAMALGLDPSDPGIMRRPPRPVEERILTRSRWIAVVYASTIMATGTLAVLVTAPGPEGTAGTATVAGTMAFTTFVLFQFFNILNVRSESNSVFRRQTFTNWQLWAALAAVIVLQVGVVHLGPVQNVFDTTSLTLGQWGVSLAVASSILWLEEARKMIVRRR